MYKVFLDEVRDYFNISKESIHKARNEIKIISYKDKVLVVKSFKVPHLFNKIVYTFFRDSKAKKSYENSMKILDFVPDPVGFRVFKKFGLIHDSYFVSEKFNYDFTIREPLLSADFENKEEIFKQFALFSYQLHEQGIFHLDYSPGNILIKREEEKYVFKIVDINRMEFKRLTLDVRLKNFSKLWAKDADLEVIVKAYAALMGEDKTQCIKKALYYSQKNKDIKNFKKRLKGEKVVD